MIVIISKKDFQKNAKKLVEKKEYLICDGTDNDSGSFSKYSRVVSMDAFNPPAKLIKARLSDGFDAEIDSDKVKKLEKKYFNQKEFKTVVMACIKDIVTTNDAHTLFIVLTNKAYKAYGKKIAKRIEKICDVEFDFVYLYDDIANNKNILKKTLKEDKIKKLSKLTKKFESDIG